MIVLNQIVPHPRNAPWERFASKQDRIRQGLAHYRARTPGPHQRGYWKLLEHLHLIFQREVPEMAYTMDDFLRDTDELALALIQRDPEAVLQHFNPEQRLQGLDPAIIEAWLAKQRRGH